MAVGPRLTRDHESERSHSLTQVVTRVSWVMWPADERHKRLEMEYVAPWTMKLEDRCAYHSGIAAWVEMLVILLSEGAGLLIDRVSAQGWQGTAGADRWESCVAVLKAREEFSQEMRNKITQASSESQKIIEVKRETEPEVDVVATTAASELVLTAPVAKDKEWERARDRSLAKHLLVSDGSRQSFSINEEISPRVRWDDSEWESSSRGEVESVNSRTYCASDAVSGARIHNVRGRLHSMIASCRRESLSVASECLKVKKLSVDATHLSEAGTRERAGSRQQHGDIKEMVLRDHKLCEVQEIVMSIVSASTSGSTGNGQRVIEIERECDRSDVGGPYCLRGSQVSTGTDRKSRVTKRVGADQKTRYVGGKSGISSANLATNRQQWVRKHPTERRN